MIKLSTHTSLDNVRIRGRAIDFFSLKNGLEMKEEGDCCLLFEGAGGYVRVTLVNNGKTEVTVESREHEFLAEEFVGKL